MSHRPPMPGSARAARWCIALAFAFAMLGRLHADAHAHLALVRQGPESAGIPGTGEEFGRSVATGDFNGDGVEDLATGAPYEANNVGQTAAHGAVVVNFGSVHGLVPEGAQWLTVGDVPDLSVRYGEALAVGDFDKDGYDDLAVGAPYQDLSGHPSAGAVWVHYGSPAGLQSVPGIVLDQSLAGGARENEDRFGNALASGDFDLDGYDDLVVGAPGEDLGAGAVFHFYGSPAGITAAGAGWFKQSSLGQLDTPGDAMGQSLATGRMDNDAFPDVAVGTPMKEVGGFTDCGRVYVLRGSSAGLVGAGGTSFDPVSLAHFPQDNARFGASVATGHFFDTNGPLDLAIGSPGVTLGFGETQAGRVAVLDLDPIPAPSLVPQQVQSLYQLNDGSDQFETGDQFGLVLASGRYNLDTYDDLAVAAPYENLELGVEGTFLDAGNVSMLRGSPGGLVLIGKRIDAASQNDQPETGELMGWSLAFGRFDDTGRDNLAIGTIRKDYLSYRTGVATVSNAGLVHIVAPWRQIQNLPHRASMVLDCDGDIVYSQRMFDSLRPASTTKTMTLLLACEAVANGSAQLGHLYTVPSWVANNVGGSQMGLVPGEKITLENLMKGLMPPSGNDAAYAIADILEGDNNPWGGSYGATLPAFQTRMNDRAADLAMTRTQLTNPPGLDVGSHYTCARDFTALAYYAMQNTCVRQIVGAPGWLVDHLIPVDTQDGWLSIGGPNPTPGYTPVTEYFSAGYMSNIRSVVPSATGVKGGHTTGARVTGLWSATAQEGEVYAGAFGMRTTEDDDPVSDCLSCTGGGLLELGRARCRNEDFAPLPPPPPDGPFGTFTSVPACKDSVRRLTVHGDAFARVDAKVQLYRRANLSPALRVRLAIVRNSQVTIAPQAEVVLGAGAVSAYQGARITNRGGGSAQLQMISTLPPGATFNAFLLPESSFVAPKYSSPASLSDLRVRNVGTVPVVLEVEELGYQLERTLGLNVPGRPAFEATLKRGGSFTDEVFGVYVVGMDQTCGDDLDIVLTPPGGTTGVPDGEPMLSPGAGLALAPAQPNPFRTGTAIAYELERTGSVTASVFDAQGRRVRNLLDGEVRAPGRHVLQWNGEDDAGTRTRTGIYFVRVEAGGAVRTRSVIRLE